MPRQDDVRSVVDDAEIGSRHDLSVIEVCDPLDRVLPNVGIVHVKDAETGRAMRVDTSLKQVREAYKKYFDTAREETSDLLGRYAVDSVRIATNEDYVKGLMSFFKKR